MPRQWTLDLGGSFSQAIVSTDYEPVPEATPYYLQASDFTGFNVDLVLQRSVPLASGSVRLALVDEFGNILAEMTTAATDADPTREVVTTVNLPITPSWCWLAGQVSASGVIGHGKGYLRIRRTT